MSILCAFCLEEVKRIMLSGDHLKKMSYSWVDIVEFICLFTCWCSYYQVNGANLDLFFQSRLFAKHQFWLVGFGFNGPLRPYFSLYLAVSQREGEREEKGQMRVKMFKQPPPAPTASAIGPCPTKIQIVGRPDTGSFQMILCYNLLP